MGQRVKVAACILLMLFAAMAAAAVLGDLGVIPAASMGGYVLRDCGGYIGIYGAADDTVPREMTDIRVDRLPLGDQLELARGVEAGDYGAVIRLLEDYGA